MKKLIILLVLFLVGCDDDGEYAVTPGYLIRHGCTYSGISFERDRINVMGRVVVTGKERLYVYGCAVGSGEQVMSKTLLEKSK